MPSDPCNSTRPLLAVPTPAAADLHRVHITCEIAEPPSGSRCQERGSPGFMRHYEQTDKQSYFVHLLTRLTLMACAATAEDGPRVGHLGPQVAGHQGGRPPVIDGGLAQGNGGRRQEGSRSGGQGEGSSSGCRLRPPFLCRSSASGLARGGGTQRREGSRSGGQGEHIRTWLAFSQSQPCREQNGFHDCWRQCARVLV